MLAPAWAGLEELCSPVRLWDWRVLTALTSGQRHILQKWLPCPTSGVASGAQRTLHGGSQVTQGRPPHSGIAACSLQKGLPNQHSQSPARCLRQAELHWPGQKASLWDVLGVGNHRPFTQPCKGLNCIWESWFKGNVSLKHGIIEPFPSSQDTSAGKPFQQQEVPGSLSNEGRRTNPSVPW